MRIPHVRRRSLLKFCLAVVVIVGVPFAVALIFVLSKFSGDAVLPADCAIVFGAAVHMKYDEKGRAVTSQAGPGIERRVATAVALYRAKLVNNLFMSGGRGEGSSLSEAVVMRDYAIAHGVSSGHIVIEAASRSTEENLLFTRPLTGSCSSVVGISDRYHLARIEFIAKMQGWQLSTLPAQGRADAVFEVWSVIREIGALFMFTATQLLT